MRKILIRFDDICPTMNFEEFDKATILMDKLGIKPLIGVIPWCKDKELQIDEFRIDFWKFIKELEKKDYKIAMHGYEHVYDSKKRGVVNSTKKSEFAGHSLEFQVEKIKNGKKILNEKNIYTDIFFAPAHSYDQNTLKALAQCGFKYISDGMSRIPIERFGIICIPCRTGGIPIMKKNGYYTAVFHAHEWPMESKCGSYEQFEEFCIKNQKDICSFDEYCNQDVSKKITEKVYEFIYVFLQIRLRPILSKIKWKIIKKRR